MSEHFTEGMAKLDELQTAPYQRPLDQNQVTKIDKEFLPALARQLQVAVRGDGSLFIIDGQHTVKALKNKGYEEWSTRFHHGLSYEEEANRFVYYNESTRRVQSVYKFKARLESKDIKTKDIANILSRYDLAIPGTENRDGLTPIRSVVMLERLYESGGEPLLSAVLDIAKKAWGDEEPVVTYNTRVIPGLARLLLHSTVTLKQDRFLEVLTSSDFYPKKLEKMVKGVAGANSVVAKRLYSAYIDGVGFGEAGRKNYKLRQKTMVDGKEVTNFDYPYLSAVQPIELMNSAQVRKIGTWNMVMDTTTTRSVTINKPTYLSA